MAICLCLGILLINVKATEASNSGSTPTTIQPVSLEIGDEDTSSFPSYDIVIPVSTKSVVVPIEMQYKGQLKINLLGKVVTKSTDITLYSDEACTSKVGYSGYLYSSTLEDDMDIDIPQKGTYYLKFESKYEESDSTVAITPYSFSSEDKTLKNKEWIGSHPFTYDSEISHKITVNSPGYIAVEGAAFSDYGSISVTLCNSSKKLSAQESLSSYNSYTTFFAVKKGTYYIKAKSSDDYKLRYTFTAVKENSGQSKTKATTIGKGKTVKGLIQSQDSVNKVDWFKIKLTKNQKLNFSASAKSCDSIKFEIVPASSRVILFGSSFRLYDSNGDKYSTKDSLPAGTYYIKVTKTDSNASGYYSIKLY
jgi:hypothetical protein